MYQCMLLSCLSAVNGFLLGKGRSLVLQNWGHFISIIDGSKMSFACYRHTLYYRICLSGPNETCAPFISVLSMADPSMLRHLIIFSVCYITIDSAENRKVPAYLPKCLLVTVCLLYFEKFD